MRGNISSENKNIVNVLFFYDGDQQYARPVRLTYLGEDYDLGAVQFWYTEHRGQRLVHHYTIGDRDGTHTFKLALETENLTWKLEKITTHKEASQPFWSNQSLVGAL